MKIKDQDTRLSRAKNVAQREIEGEILLVPVRSDPKQEMGIFTLNKTGGALWSYLEQERSLGELADMLCQSFRVDRVCAEKDVWNYCSQMLEAGMVLVVDPAEKESG